MNCMQNLSSQGFIEQQLNWISAQFFVSIGKLEDPVSCLDIDFGTTNFIIIVQGIQIFCSLTET